MLHGEDSEYFAQPDDTVGTHLRRWRSRRHISQLRLALDCDVSTRHISFVETGRSRPSRDLILHLARRLHPTSRELNLCLLAANYAPAHLGYDDGPVSTMLEAMLSQHDPAPAFVFDASWTMRRLNRGGQWLCSIVLPRVWAGVSKPETGIDMLAALTHPEGLLSTMRDAGRVGAGFLQQLRLEQLTNPSLGNRVDQFERSLRERFHPPEDDRAHDPSESGLTLEFDTALGAMSFFTAQGVFGMPQHITVGSLRSELWFPADAHTRATIHAHVPPLDHIP